MKSQISVSLGGQGSGFLSSGGRLDKEILKGSVLGVQNIYNSVKHLL